MGMQNGVIPMEGDLEIPNKIIYAFILQTM